MNLKQYLKTNPLSDLATTQAFSETVTKMISPDMMVAFLTTFGDVINVMNSVTNEAKGLQLALQFGSEFNLIDGHPASVAPLLTKLIADSVISQELMDYAISYANQVKFPLADTTQEQYDAAVFENSLDGLLDAHSYTIGGFPINEPNAYIIKTRELIVDVIFDAVVPVNTMVTVRALLLDVVTDTWVPESTVDTVRVSAGSTSKNYRIGRSFSARKMKFEATCSNNLPFQVVVREA